MGRDRYDYDKDIIDGSGNISGAAAIDLTGNITLTGGGSITTTSNGNITLLPNGTGITIVGDAGTANRMGFANDNLFVSGHLEVDGNLYLEGILYCYTGVNINGSSGSGGLDIYAGYGAHLYSRYVLEEVTIPVGSGLDPVVVSTTNLAPANSIIKAVACRVTQAPGGGATTLDIGRSSGGNTDEFIDGISTALGTTGNSAANGDGTHDGPCNNATADTLTLTTDADVTGTAMKVRIAVWYDLITNLTS